MKDFLRIFKWFGTNLFKLISILIGVFIIFIIVMFMIPIFQIIGFVGEGVIEFQNIFEEMEKHLEEFQWEKEPVTNPDDNNQV